MQMSLTKDDLIRYVGRQLEMFFPDGMKFDISQHISSYNLALERLEYCLDSICVKGYHDEKGNVTFSHLHADQYATFIWFFSNSVWRLEENDFLSSKLLQLNRLLHQIFISYKCDMPDHFFLGHPIGTVLGNAKYGDFLAVLQGVTVNTNNDLKIGKGVFLGANSKIIGSKPIGDRASVAVGTLLFETSVPDNHVAMNIDGKTIIRKRKREKCVAQRYFNIDI